LFEVQTSI